MILISSEDIRPGFGLTLSEVSQQPKPTFILSCLERFDAPVAFIETEFAVNPTLLVNCYHDAAFRMNEELDIDPSFLFFRNTLSAKKLLSLWQQEGDDVVALKKVLLHYPTIVSLRRLPQLMRELALSRS